MFNENWIDTEIKNYRNKICYILIHETFGLNCWKRKIDHTNPVRVNYTNIRNKLILYGRTIQTKVSKKTECLF